MSRNADVEKELLHYPNALEQAASYVRLRLASSLTRTMVLLPRIEAYAWQTALCAAPDRTINLALKRMAYSAIPVSLRAAPTATSAGLPLDAQ
jgi:predicted nucleic acid-binding Zn finger protein